MGVDKDFSFEEIGVLKDDEGKMPKGQKRIWPKTDLVCDN